MQLASRTLDTRTPQLAAAGLSPDQAFSDEMVELAPKLRIFAISLCRDVSAAEDLVQETMLRAWEHRAQYQPGTLLRAWLFAILRNRFLTDRRRSWRVQPLEPGLAERTLEAVSDPDSALALDETRRALNCLSAEQREAVMMIGAAGLAYTEAAEICGASVGTIKSRTSRGRARLHEVLESGEYRTAGVPRGGAMIQFMGQIDRIGHQVAA